MYGYPEFTSDVKRLTGIDLSLYKEKQMKRRLEALCRRHGSDDFRSFFDLLKSDMSVREEFLSYLTINVSEFFRNPEQWKRLESDILPGLISRRGKHLKMWSAACSTGDEPYSLAMLLTRFVPLSSIHIDATDLDRQILDKARQALYNKKSVGNVPDDLAKKFLDRTGSNSFHVRPEIQNCVSFRQHDLLRDAYPGGYDLILCRNVMIYFTDEAKEKIYRNFYQSLNPGGYLFIGSTEQMLNAADIGFESEFSFFYKKRI